MDDNRRSTSPGPHNTDTVRLAELFATGKVGCPTLAAEASFNPMVTRTRLNAGDLSRDSNRLETGTTETRGPAAGVKTSDPGVYPVGSVFVEN